MASIEMPKQAPVWLPATSIQYWGPVDVSTAATTAAGGTPTSPFICGFAMHAFAAASDTRCVQDVESAVPWQHPSLKQSSGGKRSGHMEYLLGSILDASSASRALHGILGKVHKYALSKVGCRVLQKILAMVPRGHAGVLVDELLGSSYKVAQHRYGCRVVCHLIEHHCCGEATDGTTAVFIEELLHNAPELMRNVFGHLVIKAVCIHGADHERSRVISALEMAVMANGSHMYASLVMACALEFCSQDDRDAIHTAFIAILWNLSSLSETASGCNVLRALLKFAPWEIVDQLQYSMNELWLTPHGRRLATDFSLLIHEGFGNEFDV